MIRTKSIRRATIFGTLLCLIVSSATLVRAQKLTTDEVIVRHLDAIGTAQARDAITTRIFSGTAQVIFRTAPAGLRD